MTTQTVTRSEINLLCDHLITRGSGWKLDLDLLIAAAVITELLKVVTVQSVEVDLAIPDKHGPWRRRGMRC